jgi:hypothetical protein
LDDVDGFYFSFQEKGSAEIEPRIERNARVVGRLRTAVADECAWRGGAIGRTWQQNRSSACNVRARLNRLSKYQSHFNTIATYLTRLTNRFPSS